MARRANPFSSYRGNALFGDRRTATSESTDGVDGRMGPKQATAFAWFLRRRQTSGRHGTNKTHVVQQDFQLAQDQAAVNPCQSLCFSPGCIMMHFVCRSKTVCFDTCCTCLCVL
ncbi:hypothetical protein BaRGS_00011831 [Batillaria attramentaria]|uniref:Uncharacterized protein n=1 Tax=Batillaria attramentaria TaxID=370345 RepID=A0ABD0LC12_9CAEN